MPIKKNLPVKRGPVVPVRGQPVKRGPVVPKAAYGKKPPAPSMPFPDERVEYRANKGYNAKKGMKK